ncbi:hypothetical protein HK107_09375 [Parvularcula sp. ZS-1/3]|uniref:Uncharacterized protein n=1 Tax=Parvularcula mediterranea TaxID=2732508 RepID=A0A7Y3RLZ0_9PROT|nr:hypothetical protein [Parvularcula mediterranea]NNU16529.1 hypothetical protein [Parvularcula mediterranea]
MILRRVMEHVRTQNWLAVAIDFVIVVVGVFIGIQLGNWNEERGAAERERMMLSELRQELAISVQRTRGRINSFEQVAEAGERSLAFLSSDEDCGSDCWAVLLDMFHASQWQTTAVPRTIFEEMRREGLPTSRDVVAAVSAYHFRNDILITTGSIIPEYRTLVRQRIPVEMQEHYWNACYFIQEGWELYVQDCPEPVAPEVSRLAVEAIRAEPDIALTLTEWIGFIVSFPSDLQQEITMAEEAIAEVDRELERLK